jgi:hypothetical protein
MYATGYEIYCDDVLCQAALTDQNRHNLRDMALLQGWQIDVKLNGERAKRGGRDYCPAHRRGGGSGD